MIGAETVIRRERRPARRAPAPLAFVVGVLLAFAGLWWMSPARAVDALPFKDRAEETRFQALARQLRCLQCQNESLEDSNAPLAADLRREIFERMRAGKSDAEIKDWLTARYSDFVLYDPPLRGGTWLLWFGPLLLLAAGALALVVAVRRRARGDGRSMPVRSGEDDW